MTYTFARSLSGLLVFFAGIVATPIAAQSVSTPHVQAELVSKHTALRAGTEAQIALRLKIIDHWHTYWRNPGDSGLPTKLTWTMPEGFNAGPISWPYPKKLPLGPLMNFGYEGEVLHLVQLRVPADAKPQGPITLRAKAEWLVCADVCIPESADLALELPLVTATPLPDPRWDAAFRRAEAGIPRSLLDWQATATLTGNELQIDIASTAGLEVSKAEFFPFHENTIANAAPQSWIKTQTGYRLVVSAAEPFDADRKAIEGVLVAPSGWGASAATKAMQISAPITMSAAQPISVLNTGTGLAPAAPSNTESSMSLALALLLAFAGGILLNLMPCVFPVLGLKVMGFAQSADSAKSTAGNQGIAFLIGVLVSFWILAGIILLLRATGESIGWGFQLQSPAFVTLLAMLFLVMGLNLSGVFEFGMRLQTVAADLQTRAPHGAQTDAFLSGVLATVVATPCTAPAMGAALGYTLSQPGWVAMLVFTCIGLGMALPVVLLSFSPSLLKRIPRPGAWMDTFKQFMAFPLYATVAWLAWVLGSQTDNDGTGKLLFGLVGISLAAWMYGHWQISRPVVAIFASLAVGLTAIVIGWPGQATATVKQSGSEKEWEPYSAKKLAELRSQNKSVFIDFTATWCITCQVNKRVALNDEAVRNQFAATQIVRMKADWTLKDPEITQALAAFGRNGVPLYVYYPAGENARLLPEILTPSIVLAAISGNKK